MRFSDRRGNDMEACRIDIDLAADARTGTIRGVIGTAAQPDGHSGGADPGAPVRACDDVKATFLACVASSRVNRTCGHARPGISNAPFRPRILKATLKT